MVKSLLEKGYKMPPPSGDDIPLLVAIAQKDLSKIKLLLKYGADPNSLSKEIYKTTILSKAKKTNNVEIVNTLLKYGAKN